MATIAKDEFLSDGKRKVTISSYNKELATKDHGIIGLTCQLFAINNKLSTQYIFKMVFAYQRQTEINIPANKRIVLFDKNKKYCILQSISYPGGMTDYTRKEGKYDVFQTCHYTIDDANIELLKELEATDTMRIETGTSFIEVTSATSSWMNNVLLESVNLAQKTLLTSSDDILKF